MNQLGGRRFVLMTGSKNFLTADKTDTNEFPWLRMDLTRNISGSNKLKVSLLSDDTYRMEFYNQKIDKKTFNTIITKKQTFDGVYCDQLKEIFETVTGLYTTL
ncbi:MAG: hypothetical protein PHC28_15615 [Flavobacterium sp.]|nr:hypothetical protein [Flavobacterium sp.]